MEMCACLTLIKTKKNKNVKSDSNWERYCPIVKSSFLMNIFLSRG